MAPVVRAGADGRELAMMRWGFPCPPSVPGNRAVTNIRNTASSYWRAWMKPENRCLVPATSFCEYAPGKPAVPHWFALGEDRPLFVLAGLWRPWTGVRGTKADPAHGAHELFAFPDLRAERCCGAGPSQGHARHPDHARGVRGLAAPVNEALRLQRPLPDALLSIVAKGEKQDPAPGCAATSALLL